MFQFLTVKMKSDFPRIFEKHVIRSLAKTRDSLVGQKCPKRSRSFWIGAPDGSKNS